LIRHPPVDPLLALASEKVLIANPGPWPASHHHACPCPHHSLSGISSPTTSFTLGVTNTSTNFFRVLSTMSTKSTVREDITQQICTYVFKIQDDEEHENNADIIKNNIQSILGSEHEVISVSKMRFSTPSTDDSSVFQFVIKVKTNSPTHVATKFMGNDWVREDHILFKASRPASLPPTNISENANNT
jgi:hypothetical protein